MMKIMLSVCVKNANEGEKDSTGKGTSLEEYMKETLRPPLAITHSIGGLS